MRNLLLRLSLIMVTLSIAQPVRAALDIFTCEPEWAALVKELGGSRINSYSATTAFQDPHHIEARPSLIAKVRQADLVVCSGAELEAGWLPLLQRQAGNPSVLNGKHGFFEASAIVERLDIPIDINRSLGDVHASGNPHIHLDPRRITKIAKALKTRLIDIDPEGTEHYQRRYDDFKLRWKKAINRWQEQATSLKGKRIVVHHRDWVYLFDWLEIKIAGALEPSPGLPTTVGHLVSLKHSLTEDPASMIVHTVYQNPRPAEKLSSMTGLPVVELPYTVGGDDEATDLFGLFDVTIKKLTEALR